MIVKKDVTIYDIAKSANVSPATVSRVLTSNPLVKESTRQMVLDKMRESGFTPNESARSLTKKQTNLIGFILPDISNPFFSQVFIEFERLALEKGFTVLLRNSMDNSEIEAIHLREFSERRVECIIFMGGRINKAKPEKKELEEMSTVMKRVPIIMVNGKMKGMNGYNVRTDEVGGIEAAIEYLLALGHRKIAYLGEKKGVTATDIKIATYKKTLKKNQISIVPKWQIYSDFNIEGGRKATRTLLESDQLPTAIMGMNDLVIYGVLKELRMQNIPIRTFSYVGFDDIFLSDIVYPSLTTVNHNYQILSMEMMNLFEMIKKGKEIKRVK
ncbi:LacI family DNA-binding transcriptional regulator [Alkalihalobacillus trypoxylicola]|uniref:HTH lacI-type domain-containing protein n=1 Tax=Alkalihalobacillus trypoxylicola TaxID=519424 RepID=A0A161PLM4_9BACI|nr:LacI family DNA-binding transcriptional regulator [Alkalihalobacillus trypoxylicola]KYG35286.1 hypothetical protein AZF04_02820 [Alkalihalobacillus trypoxylicola]